MKFVTAMYVTMAMMLVINLANTTFFTGAYDGITVWLCTGVFVLGTIFFCERQAKIFQQIAWSKDLST